MQSPQTGLGLLGASPPLLIKADRCASGHEGGDVYGEEGSSGYVTVPHFIDETLRLGRLYDLTDDTAVTPAQAVCEPPPSAAFWWATCVLHPERGNCEGSEEASVFRKRVTSELFRQ